jgi:hypothetical protein
MATTNHKHFEDISEQTYDFLMGIKEDHPDMTYPEIYAAVRDAVTIIEEDD